MFRLCNHINIIKASYSIGVFIVSILVLFSSIFMLFKMNKILIEHTELWKNKEEN
jgi:hypothetical protein